MVKITIIGGGNMGEALLAGFLADGVTTPAGLWVTDVASDRLAALRQRYGVRTGNDNAAAAAWADVIVLAVKPQAMDAVLDGLKDRLSERPLIVSVAAGIPLSRITARLGGARKLVRVMPNTPCLVRRVRRRAGPGHPAVRGGGDGRGCRRAVDGRRHRPERQRPGVRVPDHRGLGGRRRQGGTAARHGLDPGGADGAGRGQAGARD